MPKRDLYQEVTDQIIASLEAGLEGEWEKPWVGRKGGLPYNATTKRRYNGINVLMLWSSAMKQGFNTDAWASYKQWQERGAQVRKGQRGTMVVYVGKTTVERETSDGDTEEQTVTFLKSSVVFNVDQVEGFSIAQDPLPELATRLEHAEAFVANTAATIHYGGTRACYIPSIDQVNMPPVEAFTDTSTSTATEAFYGTLLHELTHWTGAKHRCAREFGKRFGNDAYAAEELVAELGAAYLCAHLGITSEPRADHAKYIKSWLGVLRADKKAIFTAASKASEACDFLCDLQAGAVAKAA